MVPIKKKTLKNITSSLLVIDEVHEVRCSNSTLESSGPIYGLMMVLPLGRGKCFYSRVEERRGQGDGLWEYPGQDGFLWSSLITFFPRSIYLLFSKGLNYYLKKKCQPRAMLPWFCLALDLPLESKCLPHPSVGIYRNCVRWRGSFPAHLLSQSIIFQNHISIFFLVEVQSALGHNCWGAIF